MRRRGNCGQRPSGSPKECYLDSFQSSFPHPPHPSGTRVKAPAFPSAYGNPSVQVANMKALRQSSFRDPHHQKKVDIPNASSCPGPLDLHRTVQVATWNVLTLDRTGYQVALSREMARLSFDIVGLTETRIVNSGKTDVEDLLLLQSGGTTHTHRVALMLRRKCKKALKS